MSDKRTKKDSLEVSSQTLKDELVAIKDRLGAIETIQSISNKSVVEKYVRDHLISTKSKLIMKECEEPRTRDYLVKALSFNNRQALDHHLNPLREDDLVEQQTDEEGSQTFVWSKLFKGLGKATRNAILSDTK